MIVVCAGLRICLGISTSVVRGQSGHCRPGEGDPARPSRRRNCRAGSSDFHLKSILNLRGEARRTGGTTAEVRTAQENGLSFYDLPLSATRRPAGTNCFSLIDILQQCPYPLLIHCKSGADRTGLASALYLMLERGETPEQAERAFSIEFGHVPLGGHRASARAAERVCRMAQANRLPHTPERFRDWVKNEYQSADPPSDPPPYPTGPRPDGNNGAMTLPSDAAVRPAQYNKYRDRIF